MAAPNAGVRGVSVWQCLLSALEHACSPHLLIFGESHLGNVDKDKRRGRQRTRRASHLPKNEFGEERGIKNKKKQMDRCTLEAAFPVLSN